MNLGMFALRNEKKEKEEIKINVLVSEINHD